MPFNLYPNQETVPLQSLVNLTKPSMKNRRKFIKLGAAMGVGAFLPLQFCAPKKESDTLSEAVLSASTGILDNFGLQLYSVKENMAEDAVATIKAVADYGYTQIEGFDGGKGIFWGMKNTEFKSLTDDLGLSFIASHANTYENLEKQAEEAAAIGMKYLINPWVGPQKSMDDFKRITDDFNKQGEICKQHGIKFAYHNHGYTFVDLDGQIPHDYLLENTNPDLVDFEMDMYWTVAAGVDPIAYMKKFPNRFKLVHVKDLAKTANGIESCIIGKGSIDYKSLLPQAAAQGVKYFIVEQEAYTGTTELDCAKENAIVLNNLDWRA